MVDRQWHGKRENGSGLKWPLAEAAKKMASDFKYQHYTIVSHPAVAWVDT